MKKLLALAIGSTIMINLLPPPAQANVAAGPAIGACAANPAACAIIGAGAATWILWSNGTKLYCTYGTCQRTNQAPREFRQYNEPGKVETHAVTTADLCRRMEQKFLMQGRRLKLHRIRRTTNPGLRYDCEFIGEDAVEGWFHDRRGGR